MSNTDWYEWEDEYDHYDWEEDEKPDYYADMLANMKDEDIDVMDDESPAVTGLLNEARLNRINSNSFVHNERRDGARTRAFYKTQARRDERRAGKTMLREVQV